MADPAPGWDIGYDASLDKNNAWYSAQPGYVFVNGRWQNANGGRTAEEIKQGYYVDSQGRKIPLAKPGESTKTTAQEQSAFGGLNNTFQSGLVDLGLAEGAIKPGAPGSALDTGNADAERKRLEVLLADLQQQAATGGGEWENTLENATAKSQASVAALGQQPGADYGSSLRNIGNAQGAVAQRAVGQGNVLRAQSKQAATDQMTGLLGGMGEQDINQADAMNKAVAGRRAANASLAEKAGQTQGQIIQGTGQTITSLFSDGGKVPGEAQVFGNDERNDTVHALLSPDEIVIPRSHAGSPEDAADFVRALMRNQPQRFAGGGTIPDDGAATASPVGASKTLWGDSSGTFRPGPTVDNGGLLDSSQFAKTRQATAANEDMLSAFATGQGPSVAPQQVQNSMDDSIAGAMRASSSGKVPQGDILQGAGAAAQGGAGEAAATTASEQRAGQAGLVRSSLQTRGQELGLSTAEQQAAWRHTMLNSGVGIAQANQLRQLMGGAGQAATAFAASDSSAGDNSFDFGGSDHNTPDLSSNDYAGRGSASDLSNDDDGDPDDWDLPAFADGGVVPDEDERAKQFLSALRRRG